MAADDLLIVIAGPTASGKSALALELAERYNGEIICADSRTIYRGMDIGTAKPSREDQARVPHHLLDVVDPDERYTAADFQTQARQVITEIRQRGHIPFVVGGTGLYIDGLILDYSFGPVVGSTQRAKLEHQTVEELQEMLKKQRIPLPHNHNNKRYLVRALEQGGVNTNRGKTPPDLTIVVAIATEKAQLDERIRTRAQEIFGSGIVDEAKALALRYGWDHESMTGNIYPIVKQYLDNEISLEQAKERFIIKDRQLAKRQVTWLKRHDFVKWLTIEDARTYLRDTLESIRG
jgi:tRNA dimethylallyltransferase